MGVIDFAVPLGLTLLLESVVALVWGLRKQNLLLFVLVNVLTNPLAVLLYTVLKTAFVPIWFVVAFIELGVVAVEAFCYGKFGDGIRKPWFFSLAANAFSFFVGLGIGRLI